MPHGSDSFQTRFSAHVLVITADLRDEPAGLPEFGADHALNSRAWMSFQGPLTDGRQRGVCGLECAGHPNKFGGHETLFHAIEAGAVRGKIVAFPVWRPLPVNVDLLRIAVCVPVPDIITRRPRAASAGSSDLSLEPNYPCSPGSKRCPRCSQSRE